VTLEDLCAVRKLSSPSGGARGIFGKQKLDFPELVRIAAPDSIGDWPFEV